jgi:RNA polymerase sigma-70 factor (ECF subfamily)
VSSLADAIVRSRAAWPGIEVPEDAFAKWLELRQGGGAELQVTDLWLACACARGDPRAVRAFDRAFGPALRALHARFGYLSEGPDDFLQSVHEALFVGDKPKIEAYSGKGALRAWLSVTVTRLLLNAKTRRTREVPVADQFFDALAGPSNPEALHLRKAHAQTLREALGVAIERLSLRHRNMLRYAVIDDLGIDAIAKIYAVHRATAARWLASAKDALAAGLRDALRDRLGTGTADLRSLMHATVSQLELSLARHLQPE